MKSERRALAEKIYTTLYELWAEQEGYKLESLTIKTADGEIVSTKICTKNKSVSMA